MTVAVTAKDLSAATTASWLSLPAAQQLLGFLVESLPVDLACLLHP